jgi:catechol 2,3-dioxygenase-like lactoylglutathione lyase family enzyme
MNKTTVIAAILSAVLCAYVIGFSLGHRVDAEETKRAEKKGLLPKEITQIGLVVRDVEKTAKAYADMFGMEMPQIIITEPLAEAKTQYIGKPTEARAKLAFFRFENITIELIEPMGGPSTWKRFLDEEGEGVHHIAFNTPGMDSYIGALAKQGIVVEQEGLWTGGSGGRYAYPDATAKLGVILELLENY